MSVDRAGWAYLVGYVLLAAYIFWSTLANFSLGMWLDRCL